MTVLLLLAHVDQLKRVINSFEHVYPIETSFIWYTDLNYYSCILSHS